MVVMLLILGMVGAPGVTTDPEPPLAPAARLQPHRPAAAALRLVLVGLAADGIVLDGIVERGTALGPPATPVTLLLQCVDLCAAAAIVKELKEWAELDAIVDVALVDDGAAAAALSTGESAVQLPILGVRS